MRKIFFTDYEWSLAANVLSNKKKVVTHDDTTTVHKPMQVCDVMVEDGLKSIDALRAALLSADFYKYRNLYCGHSLTNSEQQMMKILVWTHLIGLENSKGVQAAAESA